MESNLLSQYVNTPTRGENILDLVISNYNRLVHHTFTENYKGLSDHDMVNIILKPFGNLKNPHVKSEPPTSSSQSEFRLLQMNSLDYTSINQELANIQWENLKEDCSNEDFLEKMKKNVFSLSQKHSRR